MELRLSPELEGKLALAADRRGVSVEVLAREALERAVDYDDWFIQEVETGLAAEKAPYGSGPIPTPRGRSSAV